MFDPEILFAVGLLFVIVGFVVVVLAFFLLFFRGIHKKEEVKGGAVIMIGPIPIIFGTDNKSVKIMLVLAIVLMIVALVMILFANR